MIWFLFNFGLAHALELIILLIFEDFVKFLDFITMLSAFE
jgi:hypothetical protein